MDDYPLIVLAPIVGLCADVFVHIAASWITAGKRVLGCLLSGIGAGLLTTFGVCLVAAGRSSTLDWAALTVFDLVAYLALAYGYLNFVNLNIASLRIRVLQELRASPEGLSRAGILKLYDARSLVDARIRRLTQGNQIRVREGRFYTRPSFLLAVARGINLMKFVVLGKRPRH
jgi:hypothetical protein